METPPYLQDEFRTPLEQNGLQNSVGKNLGNFMAYNLGGPERLYAMLW